MGVDRKPSPISLMSRVQLLVVKSETDERTISITLSFSRSD